MRGCAAAAAGASASAPATAAATTAMTAFTEGNVWRTGSALWETRPRTRPSLVEVLSSVADRRSSPAGLHRTIPALPVRDVGAAVACYRERFGFTPAYEAPDFAVLRRDDAVLHLWGATDEEWRTREKLERQPICSG